MISLVFFAFWLQTLELPRIGCVLGNDGDFRLLFGVRGNFLLGDPGSCQPKKSKFNPSGDTLAFSRTKSREVLVLKQGWLYTLVGEEVTRQEAVPEAISALLWPDRAMLLQSEEGVFFRLPNGETTKLDLDSPAQLRWISENWAQCGGFALERRGDKIETYVLPEPHP